MPRRLSREERLAEFARLRRDILAGNDEGERRARLVALLAPESSWADLALGVELAIETIHTPDTETRALLRQAFERCAQPHAQDQSAMIRTGIVRLLGREPERADLGLFRESTATYLFVERVDVAAEMRGLALRAVAAMDPEDARWIASRLLFDNQCVPNQEPNRTAVDVLCRAGDHTLLLHWLDGFAGPHPPEAAALAEEELAQSMPLRLWLRRASERLGDERPIETLAAVTGALKRNDGAAYSALQSVLLRVGDLDLFRALAFTFATARETAIRELLLALAEDVRDDHLAAYIEAVEVCRSPRRDAALTTARRRIEEPWHSG
jgi:hypothetical protein